MVQQQGMTARNRFGPAVASKIFIAYA
jgi:hypothetical protein